MSTALNLSDVSIDAAHQHLLELDRQFGILPVNSSDELTTTIERIVAAATSANLENMAEVLDMHRHLLAVLTGVRVGEQTRSHPSRTADPLHLHRNVLLALLLAATLRIEAQPQAATAGYLTLHARVNCSHARPYLDDEITVLRLYTLGMCLHGSLDNVRSAATYALVETGLQPGETTKVKVDALALEGECPIVSANGNGRLKGRVIQADPFAVKLLNRHLHRADLRHPDQLVTYHPRRNHKDPKKTPSQRYAAACASAQGVIDNIRKATGLAGSDTTASSIAHWRIQTTYETDSADAALQISGCKSIENLAEVLWHGTHSSQRPTENLVTEFNLDD